MMKKEWRTGLLFFVFPLLFHPFVRKRALDLTRALFSLWSGGHIAIHASTHTGENEAAVMDDVPFIISSNYPHRHGRSNNKKQERGSSNASLLQQKRNQGRAFALLQLHIFRDKVEMSHLPHFMLQPHVVEL